MWFTGDGVGKFSIKCTTQHRPVSSIKTTTSRPSASRLKYMSTTASLKESSDGVNIKKGTYPFPRYGLKNGNVEIKFFLTSCVLNISTADSKSSS